MLKDTPERALVRDLGDRIGYGRLMQLAEDIWDNELMKGAAHSVGPCTTFLVACPHDVPAHQCDWCCGSGRVTERVRRAMEEYAKSLK